MFLKRDEARRRHGNNMDATLDQAYRIEARDEVHKNSNTQNDLSRNHVQCHFCFDMIILLSACANQESFHEASQGYFRRNFGLFTGRTQNHS